MVRRDVVRLVTPGTLTEDSLLDAKTRNYLTAIFCFLPRRQVGFPLALASLGYFHGRVRDRRSLGRRLCGRDHAPVTR